MNPKLEKLAALGAVAVSGGVALLDAALIKLMWPNRLGGSNITMLAVEAIATTLVAGLIIAAHLALAKQLFDDASVRMSGS